MSTSKVTVDEFVIQMSLQETVLRGLAKLEKQILPIANRIEKSLNRPFAKDHSAALNTTFKNIEKRAEKAGKSIHRALSHGFDIGQANSGLFNRYESEGLNAARKVGAAMRAAYRVRGSAPPLPPLPRPAGQPRISTRQRIEDIHQRQLTSGFYGQMQLRDADRAAQYRSRLERLRMESTAAGDFRGFRQNLRTLNHEFAQTQRVASQQRAAQRLQALEASNAGSGLSRLADSAGGLVAGFFALNRAMSFLQESIQVGGQYQQAHTMSVVAYGNETEATRMTLKADNVSRDYGLDPLLTRQQMAQMRMTMPDSFNNDKIAKLFENESVWAHTTGMTNEAVGRLNYALMQIAASPRLMGQDWMQVVNASPALVKALQKLNNFTDARQVRDYYAKRKGSDFVEDTLKVTTPTQQQKTMAQQNIIAAQGRLAGSLQLAKRDFFDQMEKPMVRLFATLTDSADQLGSTLKPVSKSVGFLADRLSDVAENANSAASNITGYAGLASESFDKLYSGLDKSTQQNLNKLSGVFNQFFDVLIAVVAGKLALAGVSKIGQMAGLGGIGGVMGAAGRTFAVAAAVVLGKELGDLVFDQWIPAFHKAMGWDDTKTTHGGNVVEGSWVDTGLNWLDRAVDTVKQSPLPITGYPSLAPSIGSYLPPAQQPITFAPLKLEVTNTGSLNVTMPDGSMQRVALDVVQQQHEFQMMSAQGLQGNWQGAGQNAGFSPSSLMR